MFSHKSSVKTFLLLKKIFIKKSKFKKKEKENISVQDRTSSHALVCSPNSYSGLRLAQRMT